jgi:uncharacterized protein with HEPN domain
MVKRSVKVRIKDILDAIDEVKDYINSSTFDEYERDPKTRRAVERCIEIISEAVRYLPPELTGAHPDVPWNEIRAIGNILRHNYQRVSDLVIWRTATIHLPRLHTVILEMKGQVDADEATGNS